LKCFALLRWNTITFLKWNYFKIRKRFLVFKVWLPYTENDEFELQCNLLSSQNIFPTFFFHFFFFILVCAFYILCGNSCLKIIKILTYILLTFPGKAPFSPNIRAEMVGKRWIIKLLNYFYRTVKRF